MIVLAVAGMPGSGKSAVVSFLSGHTPSVSMGDIVREYTGRKGLETTPENVASVAVRERELYGMDIWACRTVDRILTISADVVVIDGLRGGTEVQTFRKHFGEGFKLIAVHATPETRYSRMLARGRVDDPSAKAHLMERDRREISWGVQEAIDSADHTLINEGPLEDLGKGAEKLLHDLGALRD